MDARNTPKNRLTLASLILFSCIGCDQATKSAATQTLKNSPPQSFLADTVRFQYALNPGGFLSLGSDLPEPVRSLVFVGFNMCVALCLCWYLFRSKQASWLVFASLVFILAGALGNLIDRITNDGLVTDFINLGIGPIRTGVFNVADMAVMFGAITAVLLAMRGKPTEQGDGPITTANE